MDYKEFEIVYYDLSFQPSKDNQNVVFHVKRNDPHGYFEENRKIYQDKYGNMSYKAFKKEYDFHLPEFNRRKHRREVLINEFKSHKTEDFADIPLNKKLDYLDALSVDLRSNEEWYRDYNGAYDNLVACLWSIQPTEEFLTEERKKLNHFMDVLEDKNLNNFWQNIGSLKPTLQNHAIRLFLDALSEAYEIDRIPIEYYTPEDPEDTWYGYVPTGEWKMRLREDKPLNFSLEIMSLLFHESMHLRQQKMYEEDSEKYRIFTSEYGRLKTMVLCNYDRKKYRQVYELEPRESHAYYMQRHFEEVVNDRIYGGRLCKGNIPTTLARTLWFDYQH